MQGLVQDLGVVLDSLVEEGLLWASFWGLRRMVVHNLLVGDLVAHLPWKDAHNRLWLRHVRHLDFYPCPEVDFPRPC